MLSHEIRQQIQSMLIYVGATFIIAVLVGWPIYGVFYG